MAWIWGVNGRSTSGPGLESITLPGAPVPVGAIAYVSTRPFVAAFQELDDVIARWPWAIPCISLALEERHLEPVVRNQSPVGARLALCTGPSREPPAPHQVLAAAWTRPSASADMMADFVAARIGQPHRNVILTEQFLLAMGEISMPAISRSTMSRRFRALGALRAQDWRAVARLAAEVHEITNHAARDGREVDVGRALSAAGQRTRRKYLAVPPAAMSGLIGWESVLEHVLRRYGYVTIADHEEANRERERERGKRGKWAVAANTAARRPRSTPAGSPR